MTTKTNFYDVVVHYPYNFPDYVGRVVACYEEQAKRLAFYDATAKGWPRAYERIEATKLLD